MIRSQQSSPLPSSCDELIMYSLNSKHCTVLRHAQCVTSWTWPLHKKGFNTDYTRDVSTLHKEETIAVISTVHVPQNMKLPQFLILRQNDLWPDDVHGNPRVLLSIQMNNSTAVAVLLLLIWHVIFNFRRIFQNIWKLNLLKYEAEILATQFQQ